MATIAEIDKKIEQLNKEIAALMPEDIFSNDGNNDELIARKQREIEELEKQYKGLYNEGVYGISEAYQVLLRLEDKLLEKIPENVMWWMKRIADPEVEFKGLKEVSRDAAAMISLIYRTYLAPIEKREEYVLEDHKEFCADYIRSGEYIAPHGTDEAELIRRIKEVSNHGELEKLAEEFGFADELSQMGDMYTEFEEDMKHADDDD